ncbi:MAG: helix-turn-helix transcriptional regulator [Armatimonadetes bacterium]|nr:helix-turn-helix transcriptional regulator [Armatimonadota bacterium]
MDTKQFQKCLGAAIRVRRIKHGYSQESFADAVGVHRTYIGSVERGERNISLNNALAIAESLSIPLSTLIALAEAEIALPNKL